MPKQIPGKAVVDAVVLGISNAQYDYEKLSGGDWVWMAAEYWITTYVAKEIGKIPGAKLVTIESSAKQTMKDAGGSRVGRPARAARLGGRFDLLLWYANGYPRAVIEIKSQSSIDAVLKDVDRIQSVLKGRSSSSTLNFGIIGYYFSSRPLRTKSGQERVTSQLEALIRKVRAQVNADMKVVPTISDIHVEEAGDAWAACAILIS
ncbi:MAG: hypothetical protein V7667_11485 [Alloalcanivorax venustensis]|uniref:hypothetical protein n=1 Tax=Alloalcanivorax venustensis TaxID=172371 RepID=UPI0030028869|tara:strand:+ start:6047 stop:6661 length:615 start_codon:yes stop_codon:yes gene_type:complete